MNYLAHLYLSGNDPQKMIGNFIADHVKGKMIDTFSEEIREGIFLHRQIDQFTDSHPVVEASKARLRTSFRKYAPVIVDVFYDHFLARDWENYHHQPLEKFSQSVYNLMQQHSEILPERTLSHAGLHESSELAAELPANRRNQPCTHRNVAPYNLESGMENATLHLEQHYPEFEKEFEEFFADLRSFVATLQL